MCLKNLTTVSTTSSATKAAVLAKNLEVEKADLPLKMMEEENLQSKEDVIELQRLREKQRLQDEEQKRLQVEFEKAQIQTELGKKLQQKAKDDMLEYGHALEEDKCIQEEEKASKRRK